MNSEKILSINIPTYNRVDFLKEALAALIPQMTDAVEINVSDNHSTDGTWEYLGSLEGVVNRLRPPEGTNGNLNILSCAEIGTGMYTWVHCDDDIARLNAVENILRAIHEFDFPPVITFEWDSFNKDMDRFKNTNVDAKWIQCNKNEFLSKISYKFTFASAIILKRGEIDIEYVKKNSPINLIPANMIYSTTGRTDRVVLTSTPLLAARANPGNAVMLTIFTKDMWTFFRLNEGLGYDPKIIDQVYSDSLRTVVCYTVEGFRVTWSSALSSFIYSYRFKNYYTCVLPRIFRRLIPDPCRRILSIARFALRRIKQGIKGICIAVIWFFITRLVAMLVNNKGPEAYRLMRKASNKLAFSAFRDETGYISSIGSVKHPTYLHNPKFIEIGSDFIAGPGLRIEAWDRFHDQLFYPRVVIGNDVCINWNCHIGAIDRVEIHDDVLIGSNVLITDHFHGSICNQDLENPPAKRQLFSAGPVVIERNVWIGEGVSVLPGVRIGEGSIIGANSVVTKDVPKFSVVAGVPGKVLRSLRSETTSDQSTDSDI